MMISNDVRRAIMKCISDNGTQRRLASRIGVAPSTIGHWINGQAESIRHAHWMKLEPLILAYLPEQYRQASELSRPYEEPDAGRQKFPPPPMEVREDHAPSYLRRATGSSQSRRVPVLDSVTAAGFAPAVESLADYAHGCQADTHVFQTSVNPSCFALRVDHHTASKKLPLGTLLLIDPDSPPKTGSIVVVRMAGMSNVVCRRYYRQDGTVHLKSIDQDGEDYEIDIRKDPTRIVWMYHAILAELDLDDERAISGDHLSAVETNSLESNPSSST